MPACTTTAAKAVREALRLRATTPGDLEELLARHPRWRGAERLRAIIAPLRDLPLARARSDAESLALELLASAGRPLPDVNRRIAGEEADLSWPAQRLIVELDGPQFHLDPHEDARKDAAWRAAGWTVLRLPTDAVYDEQVRLLALAPPAPATPPPRPAWPPASAARASATARPEAAA